jgi:hypothetical protein
MYLFVNIVTIHVVLLINAELSVFASSSVDVVLLLAAAAAFMCVFHMHKFIFMLFILD